MKNENLLYALNMLIKHLNLIQFYFYFKCLKDCKLIEHLVNAWDVYFDGESYLEINKYYILIFK